jgi:erythromycin esterase
LGAAARNGGLPKRYASLVCGNEFQQRRKQMRLQNLLLTSILLVVSAFVALGQMHSTSEQKIEWLKKHAIQVRSIEPADEDFSDLSLLKELLRNVSLVLLGEESHGDGATFLAKTRLIKFLHKEMGFDILVFESGLYDCSKAWQSFNAGEDITNVFRRGVWGLWSKSQQVDALVSYLDRAHALGQPLELAGLDPSLVDSTFGESLVNELRNVVDSIDFPARKHERINRFLTTVQHLTRQDYGSGRMKKPEAEELGSFVSTASELARAIEASSNLTPQDRAFWARLLESISINARWLTLDFRNPDWALVELRDMQMARNLISLMRHQYPSRKVIVWAASMHIARNLIEIQVQDTALQALYRHKRVMGDDLWKELQGKMYSLGFTAFEGEFGAWAVKPRKLQQPSVNSFEDLLTRAGMNNAIVDFRQLATGGEWLREEMKSRPLGYTEMTARWNAVFDGMMFTKVMTPSTKSTK